MHRLLLASLLVGCNARSSAAPPPEAAAPLATATTSWSGNVLAITGGECQPCQLRFAIARPTGATEPTLAVTLQEGIGDIRVRFRGQTVTASRKRVELPLPRALFGGMDLKTGAIQLADPLEIEVAHVAPFTTAIPSQRYGAALLFGNAPPVTFADEATSSTGAVTAWVMPVDATWGVRGPGTVARDVTWLISEKRVEAASRHCAGYRDTRTGAAATTVAVAEDSVMTILDRRTGDTVKTETLKAGAPSCPDVQVGWAARATTVPRATVDAWIRRAMR